VAKNKELTLRSPRHFEEQSDEKSPQKTRFLASLEMTVRNVSKESDIGKIK